MSKQRFMKIMSWYLIISMIFQMLPISVISAWADTGSTPDLNEAVSGEGEVKSELGETDSDEIGGTEYFTVTFNTDEGPESYIVQNGGTLDELPDAPQFTEADFAGWNTLPDGTGELFETDTAVTDNLDLYPVYRRNIVRIAYYAGENGTITVGESEGLGSYIETADLSGSGAEGAAAAANDGAEFLNWTDAEGNEVTADAHIIPTIADIYVTGFISKDEAAALGDSSLSEEPDAAFTANFGLLPELTFEGSAGSVSVYASAPADAFPEGTTMVVVPVDDLIAMEIATEYYETRADVVRAAGIDISFIDAEGAEVEPQNGREVKVTLSVSGGFGSGALSLLHQDDSGDVSEVNCEEGSEIPSLETKSTKRSRSAGTSRSLSFSSGSFSVYVICETEEPTEDARLKVNFVQADGQTVVIYVNERDTGDQAKFEEILYDPGAGSFDENAAFYGWINLEDINKEAYTPEDSENGLDIGQIREIVSGILEAGVVEGAEITYHAMVFKSYQHFIYGAKRGDSGRGINDDACG